MTDETGKTGKTDTRKAARLFDVRLVIGGLFLIYGVIVTLLGIFDSSAEIDKAQGVRINLWMGLAMLALGGIMLLWLRLNPPTGEELEPEPEPEPPSDAPG
jgi:hypothetical protein